MDLNSSTGYIFNKYFSVGVGLPVYFVSATQPASGSGQAKRTSSSGIGNFYGTLNLNFDNEVLPYSSTLTLTAPSGDLDKGRSTGKMTYDWDNRFEHELAERLTPYVDAGLANSLSNTRFYKRPFLTYGYLAHFEAGMDVKIWKSLTFTPSAYDILPWGNQRVISRVVRGSGPSGTGTVLRRRVYEFNAQTTGGADLTRDNGYSAGIGFSPTPVIDLSFGFTRSVPQHLNSWSWGIGFNIRRLFSHPRT
jgi:hypothetical protein